jgi:hypothetical protein
MTDGLFVALAAVVVSIASGEYVYRRSRSGGRAVAECSQVIGAVLYFIIFVAAALTGGWLGVVYAELAGQFWWAARSRYYDLNQKEWREVVNP